MSRLFEVLTSEAKKYKNSILTFSGVVAALIGLAGSITHIFQSRINISITAIGLFFLIKRICDSIINAKKQSFGVETEAYPKHTRKVAGWVGIFNYLFLAYPIYLMVVAFIPSKSPKEDSNHFALLIAKFSLSNEDDFSYKLF